MIMKLQIALDCNDIGTALKVVEEVYPYIDIAELGTPLMISEGARAVRIMKERYPALKVLSDIKIMDGGDSIARIVLEAGADIVTVLGVTNDMTIKGVVAAAHDFKKEVFVDLISVSDVKKRAAEVDALGVNYIGVHTSYDLRNTVATPLDDLKKIKSVVKTAKVAISGGIKQGMLNNIMAVEPDVVITGSSIMNASDKRSIAKQFYETLHGRD